MSRYKRMTDLELSLLQSYGDDEAFEEICRREAETQTNVDRDMGLAMLAMLAARQKGTADE